MARVKNSKPVANGSKSTNKSAQKRSKSKRRSNASATQVMIGKKIFLVRSALLNEMKKLQKSIANTIPKAPFSRLIREILQTTFGDRNDLRIQSNALKALQESAEYYLTFLFEDANLCAAHAKRITVRPDDMKLVLGLRGQNDVYNH